MINEWIRVKGRHRAPALSRFRTIDGLYALRIVCWHGKTGDLAHWERATMENWEWYASLNPCRYVATCPQFKAILERDRDRS